MKLKQFFIPAAAMLVISLAACGSTPAETPPQTSVPTDDGGSAPAEPTENNAEPDGGDDAAQTEEETTGRPTERSAAWDRLDDLQSAFPSAVNNSDASLEGGVLYWAVPSSTTFTGIMDTLYSGTTLESGAMEFTRGMDLISQEPDGSMGHDGLATWEIDRENRSITITMQHDVTWTDGVPITLDDLVFAYEVISHPDYTGIRWGPTISNVVGAQEYRDREADSISGLVLSEDKRELTISFIDFTPAIEYFGFWTSISPRHHLEDIPVAELEFHANVRENALGWGPFVVKSYVPGESFLFERYDDFFLGAPKVDQIQYEIVPPAQVPLLAEEGRFDILPSFPQSQFPNYPNPTNYVYLGEVGPRTVWYYSFTLGHFDSANNKVVTNPDSKMYNINLRRAFIHAIPWDMIGEQLYSGLVISSPTTMPLMHRNLIDETVPDFYYDPELSVQLLEEAGYIDINDDGWREDPNGEELIIYYLTQPASTPASEANMQFQMQSWHDIGLNVQFYRGSPQDFNVFVDLMGQDEYEFDLVQFGWSYGNNPNYTNLWGPDTQLNRPRYTSPRFEELIERMNSDEMWDDEFLAETYKEWQWAFYEEMPAAPTTWTTVLTAVNNRVKNYSQEWVSGDPETKAGSGRWWLIELTADEPYVK